MSLKTRLTALTSAIADKTNRLHELAEMKANKKTDLTSVSNDDYPTVPAVNAGLALKVDKDGTKVLSDENYTTAEKTKLSGLESSKYRGQYTTLTELQTDNPTPSPGEYADVDGTTAGEEITRYIWDNNDGNWVKQQGESSVMSNSQVKSAYESNPDTNAFTDAEQTKLGGIEVGATADMTNAEIKAAYESNANTNPFTDSNVTQLSNTVAHLSDTTNPHAVTKAQVGLSNVDNTADVNKPVSTAQSTAIGVVQTDLDNYKLDVGETFNDATSDYATQFNSETPNIVLA